MHGFDYFYSTLYSVNIEITLENNPALLAQVDFWWEKKM